jgi:type III restriction enzyme
MVRAGERFAVYDKHLYVDTRGQYRVDLNSWEEETILAEIKRPDVVGWMRNYDRKPWALAVPYETELGTDIPTYPDFLVVRRDDGRLLLDILEPHRPDLDDSWKKACGLALYAKRHYMSIGRIEIIRKVGKELKRLSLIEPKVHNKVLKWVKSNGHLDQLFDEL